MFVAHWRIEIVPRWLVVGVLATEVLVLVSLTVAYVGVAAKRARQAKRVAAARQRVRGVMTQVLQEEADPARAAAALRHLPRTDQVNILAQYATSLRGSEIAAIGEELGLIELASRWVDHRRWSRRLHGIRVLDLLGHGDSVVPALLLDPHPLVRAEAARWVGTRPRTSASMRRLVTSLEDDDAMMRFAAKDALVRAGPAAVPALRSYLTGSRARAVVDALIVAVAIGDSRLAPAGITHRDNDDADARVQAARLLAATASLEAVPSLQRMLDDVDPRVRAAATRGLASLVHWESAPKIARGLEDSAWAVRRASALALRELGAPGLVLLRRARASGHPIAADIADRVLGDPGADR